MRNFFSTGLPALCLVLCLGCDTQQVAGTGSQTGNSVVAGRVLPSDSVKTVAGVRVYLRPIAWTTGQAAVGGALDSTWTDSLGNFRFTDVPLDTYRVEARGSGYGWSHTVRADAPQVQVPADSLQPWGRLVVEIDLSDTVLGGRLEFYGLNRAQPIPDSGSSDIYVEFDSLPVGLQTLRIWAHDSTYCDAPVRIGPDSTTKMDYETLDGRPKGPREDDE
ncbi:MAG TPA: carboxypeptidase-like regulatory domain-containing protein [Fibrobacteria bacterium]|nr:carboxypeptidase-like regulatory domain-containing protein [Fibrobacteria bacterium]